MKKLLTISSISFLALVASVLPASAQTKIGTVDMAKIFSSYYKSKDAEARINDAKTAAKKEFDDRVDTYKGLLDSIKKLEEEIDKPELSKEAKDEKSKARDEKIAETKNLEREINDFRTTREKQLQDQARRMRDGIVDDINKLIQDKVKSENYDLVLDKSGSSLNGVPIVIFARDTMDFSDDIIKELNATKPKDDAAATASPSPDKSPAKTDKKKTN